MTVLVLKALNLDAGTFNYSHTVGDVRRWGDCCIRLSLNACKTKSAPLSDGLTALD